MKSRLDLWEIKPGLLFAPPNHPTLARKDLMQRSRVSIQSIDAHDDVSEGKRKRRRVRRDGLEGLSQFSSVVTISWTRKGAHPLMRVQGRSLRPKSAMKVGAKGQRRS